MSVDLNIKFEHPGAVSHTVRLARIDNTNTPSYSTFTGITSSPYFLGTFPNGQYEARIKPVYADGRVCPDEDIQISPACYGVTSFNAMQQGNTLVITYLAPEELPKVLITVNYPNGGSYQTIVTNGSNGSSLTIPIPSGLYGDFVVYVQGVCDDTTGFFSPLPGGVIVGVPEPTQSNQMSGTLGIICPIGCTGTGSGAYALTFTNPYPTSITIQTAFVWRPNNSSGYAGYGGDMLPAGHPYKAAASSVPGLPNTPATFAIPANATSYNTPTLQFPVQGYPPYGLLCFPACNPTSGANADWILFFKVVSPNNGLVINFTSVDNDILGTKVVIEQIV